MNAVAAATTDATRAAERAGVVIAPLDDPAAHRNLSELFDVVWNAAGGPLVHPNLMTALNHGGNYVAGAFDGDSLIGGTVGFLALDGAGMHLHSHMTGVLARMQGRGVGLALKLHQRQWCLERDISEVVWTYDPLVRHNAYFNLMRLGAEIVDYVEDFYGAMADGINVNEESDRCVVRWQLAAERVTRALRGKADEEVVTAGATVILDEDAEGIPVVHESSGDVLLCKIPRDIVAIRRTDAAAGRAWRRALRSCFGRALAEGFVATAITESGSYVLERRPR